MGMAVRCSSVEVMVEVTDTGWCRGRGGASKTSDINVPSMCISIDGGVS